MQSAPRSDLPEIAVLMYWLMLRNVASEGIVYADPQDPDGVSLPGCIVASPSYATDQVSQTTQDYVYNWVRDAAVVAAEIARFGPGSADRAAGQRLADYVNFADTCQRGSNGDLSHAVYTVEGRPRDPWPHQNDGPALQTMTILQGFGQLNSGTQSLARRVIENNVAFLLANYQQPSTNLWEEVAGQSFFTRSVQLRCLQEIKNNSIGIAVPAEVDQAIVWLSKELEGHWSDQDGHYISILGATNPREGYEPNIDIVMASAYGALACTDTKLLATAAKIRTQWADPTSPTVYPINVTDANLGFGPLMGRYPGDKYDGDYNDPGAKGHPWVVCTANFAQLYYCVAAALLKNGAVPYSDLSGPFFEQIGVKSGTDINTAAQRLKDAGDRMLQAVVYHSNHLALSEQFDAITGYEKSVHDLSWSYAAFLSAVRSRKAIP
jgi:glucoamylase